MEGGVIAIKQISLRWHSCTQTEAILPRRGPGPHTHTICPFINKTYVNTFSARTPAHTRVRWIYRYLSLLLQTLDGGFFFFSLSPHYLVSAEKSPRAIYLPHRLSPCIHPDLCTACFFTPSTAVFRLAAPRTVSNYITIYRCVFLFFVVVVAAFTPSAEQITNGNFGSSRELHQYHLASVGTLYHEHVKNKLLLANGVTCCCCRRRSGWHYSGPRPFPSSRLPGAHHCWEGSGHFGQIAALRGEVKSVSLSFQHISGGNEQSTDGLGFRGTDGSSTRCSLSNLFMLTRL